MKFLWHFIYLLLNLIICYCFQHLYHLFIYLKGMAFENTQIIGEVKGERRAWSDEEFNALLDFLEEIVVLNKRADAGQFKNSTFK